MIPWFSSHIEHQVAAHAVTNYQQSGTQDTKAGSDIQALGHHQIFQNAP